MNIEDIKTASKETIETRASQIVEELKTVDSEGLKALSAELDAIEARKLALQKEAETAKSDAEAVKSGAGVELRKMINEGEKKMDTIEFRNSQAYIDAFAKSIKNNDYKELRALVTSNAEASVQAANGVLPVPEFVEEVVNTNWNKLPILDRIKYSEVKGNLKVSFEIEGDDAVDHSEGAPAISEENLRMGIVTIVPGTIMKYINMSREVMDLDNKAFLTYIFNELSYRVFKKAENDVVQTILLAPTTATNTKASVQEFEVSGVTLDSIINAKAKLSEEASNPVVITSRANEAYLKSLAIENHYAVDPFDGMEVLYASMPYDLTSSKSDNGCFAIIADLDGIQGNFTAGKNVEVRVDPYTLATSDLVRYIGRMPVGFGIVACDRFVRLMYKAE